MLVTKVRIAVTALLVVALCAAGLGAFGFAQVVSPPPTDDVVKQGANPEKQRDGADALGDPFPPGALRRFGSNRLSHQGNVSCSAFSPDGRLLASGGYDGAVRLWDPATGKQVGQFNTPRWVRALLWSANSDVLVYASDGDGIRFTDVATGKLLRHFKEQDRQSVTSLALSSDGKTLAAAEVDFSASSRYGVRLWDVTADKQRHHFRAESAYRVAFSRDSRLLAVGGDKNIRLWDVDTGKERPPLVGHVHGSYAVAFSPDGKLLASGGSNVDETVIFWDVDTGRETRRLPKLKGTVYALAFSPDGKTLATGASGYDDSPIRLWDVATAKELRALKAPPGPIDAMSFSPDGKSLVSSCCWGRTIRLWDAVTGEDAGLFPRHHAEVAAVAFSADGRTLATGSWDRTILLWNTATGKKTGELLGHQGRVNAIAYSPDGQLLASGSKDKTVRLWKTATGKEVRLLQAPQREVAGVAFAPDGRTLASAESMLQEDNLIVGAAFPDCAVRIWNVATGAEVRQLQAKTGRVDTVAFSPDGRILASAGPDASMIHLWDPATGRALRKLQSPPELATPPTMAEGVTRVAFSPDGRTLASVSSYRYPGNMRQLDKDQKRAVRIVRLWEVATGAERLQIRVPFRGTEGTRTAPRNEMSCVAFSADGQTLILGKVNGDVSLWHIPTAKESRLLAGHQDRVSTDGKTFATGSWDNSPRVAAVAVSADGRTFATGSWDTTAMLWDGAALVAGQRRAPVRLSVPEREKLWADLASPDAARGFQAIWAMVAAAPDILPLLKERLKPLPKPAAGRIARLIADLDDARFAVREQAKAELDTYEDVAGPALEKALASGVSLEARRRIEAILAKHGGPVPSPDALRALRAVEVLEHIDGPVTRGILQTVAQGPSESRLTQHATASLARLTKRASTLP